MDPSNTKGLAGRLYRELQQIQPNHPRVFWFRGVEAFHRQDYRSAIRYWERHLAMLDADSEETELPRRAIAKARELMGAKK